MSARATQQTDPPGLHIIHNDATTMLDLGRNRISYMARLQPVHRLPTEMLARIFLFHCFSIWPRTHIHAREGPLLVAAVCRRWRDAALSFGEIWAEISVGLRKTTCVPKVPLIETWLRRSNSWLLRVSIYQLDVDETSFYDTVAPVFSSLRSGITRIQRIGLHFQACRPDPTRTLPAPAMPGSSSELKHVFLDARNLGVVEMNWLSSFFFPSPQLWSLTWGSPHSLDRIPWDHLQSLQLGPRGDCLSRQALNSLLHTRKLWGLRLRAIPDPDASDDPLLHLGTLIHLALSANVPLGSTFDRFTLPNLNVIHIELDRGIEEVSQAWPQDNFRAFMDRSGCVVTQLSLHDVAIDAEQLLEVLSRLPSLIFLELTYGEEAQVVDGEVLEALTPQTSGTGRERQCLCPILEFIKFWNCLGGDDGQLATMAEARRNPDIRDDPKMKPLRELDLQFAGTSSTPHIDDLKRLMICKAEGLNLLVRPPEESHAIFIDPVFF
jgi:hypothetical protein